MIETIRGNVVTKEPGHVVIETCGVGYGLDISLNSYKALPGVGEEAFLHVHTYVREDTLRLFGFTTGEEREVFEVFIDVSGIGPKTGLAILSSVSIDDFAEAILSRDIDALTKIPGIGRKTAERLILELKERMKGFSYSGKETGITEALLETQLSRDAVSALISLDCKPHVAHKAVIKAQKALGEDCSLEELIKEALKHR